MDRRAAFRKRMKRWEIPGRTRNMTFSCQRRLPLLLNAAICGVFLEALSAARARFGFELFAWVLRPEHVHLLVRPRPGVPLDRALLCVKLSVATRVIGRWRVLGAPILGRVKDGRGRARFGQKGGGFDRNVRDEAEFCREVRYIHRNPVERGLVTRPEEWKWSSARWWMGTREGELPCDPPGGAVCAAHSCTSHDFVCAPTRLCATHKLRYTAPCRLCAATEHASWHVARGRFLACSSR